jgi:hypothetical protein
MPRLIGFKEFHNLKKIRVEASQKFVDSLSTISEATRKTVGNYTARRDPPHFQGDEYHAHSDVGGGHEVAWGISGKKRHEGKFPANVPKDAKLAIAAVLGVEVTRLESFVAFDAVLGEKVFLIEVRDA